MSAVASPSASRSAARKYGVGLVALTIGVTVYSSGDRLGAGAQLEDWLLWALAASLALAGLWLISGRAGARALFLPASIVGMLTAGYALAVWGLSFLFDRSAALSGDMITTLALATLALVYLGFGLAVYGRERAH